MKSPTILYARTGFNSLILKEKKRMVLIKELSGKTIPKSECIMSDYKKNYKGRKIEVGFSAQHRMIAIFVDDIWLTGTDAVLPMDNLTEQQKNTMAETDNAVAYEQEEAERNKDVV